MLRQRPAPPWTWRSRSPSEGRARSERRKPAKTGGSRVQGWQGTALVLPRIGAEMGGGRRSRGCDAVRRLQKGRNGSHRPPLEVNKSCRIVRPGATGAATTRFTIFPSARRARLPFPQAVGFPQAIASNHALPGETSARNCPHPPLRESPTCLRRPTPDQPGPVGPAPRSAESAPDGQSAGGTALSRYDSAATRRYAALHRRSDMRSGVGSVCAPRLRPRGIPQNVPRVTSHPETSESRASTTLFSFTA
jgi:hypothetical protein